MSRNLGQLAKATSTPLASIFGSGFLIIVPVLAGAVGAWSVLAMTGVCLLAYAVGGVIRFNIRNAEPVLADKPSEITLSLERTSDLALVLAYIVSVCLYLHILSAFVLGGFAFDTDFNEDILTSAVIAAVVVIGLTKGLGGLNFLEDWALYITFGIIGLLLFGFVLHDWGVWRSGTGFVAPEIRHHTPWQVLTIVAGTLIVVQGFETTRYLGEEYSRDARVSASRWSQLVSTIVYVAFVAAALPLLHTLNGHYNDNSLIKLAAAVSSPLVTPLIVAAALSQFSAAIADTVAATGNMEAVTHRLLKAKWGTIFVGGGALALTWSATTLELVAIASRAFAFYYFMQCLVALSVSKSTGRRIGIIAVACALAFITIFAVPAS